MNETQDGYHWEVSVLDGLHDCIMLDGEEGYIYLSVNDIAEMAEALDLIINVEGEQ